LRGARGAFERLTAIARNGLEGAGTVVSTIIPFATSNKFLTSIERVAPTPRQ
jgi:hypothetical protein